jgi:hypothetical protein
VQFAFDKLDDEVFESNDLAHPSIKDDLFFQELAILYAEVDNAWNGKNDACDAYAAVCHEFGRSREIDEIEESERGAERSIRAG